MPDGHGYRGLCTVHSYRDPETSEERLWIEQADVEIVISDALLSALTERGWAGEGLFKIEAINATAVYRLVERSASPDAWDARMTDWIINEAELW